MEEITTNEIQIPSPSVFLRASPTPQGGPPQPQPKPAHKRPTASKKRRIPGGNTNSANGAGEKPKQSKSRNGCITCKAKRLKCDESKPACQQCKRRSVDCGGYKKDFKWRPFGETNVRANILKHQHVPKPSVLTPPEQASGAHLSTSGPCVQTDLGLLRGASIESAEESALEPLPDLFFQQIITPPNDGPDFDTALAIASPVDVNPEMENRVDAAEITSRGDQGLGDVSISPIAASPTLLTLSSLEARDLMLDETYQAQPPTNDFGSPTKHEHEHEHFTLPEPESAETLGHVCVDDIEEIVRRSEPNRADKALAYMFGSTLSSTSDDRRTSSEASSRRSHRALYKQPSFSPQSAEMLAQRFDRFTCGILSVKDGLLENPWRTLIWPMAKTSPALYHALSCMSAYHTSHDLPLLRVTGHEHRDASVRNLLEGINEGSMPLDTAIATTLALAFAESWDQPIYSGNGHIQGARTMINIALAQHRRVALTGIDLQRLKFLCNAWVYMDVIARLTSTDEDVSDDYDQIFCLYSTPDSDHAGFGIDFGMPIDAQLDPLMGCANTLFPLVGRVANLVRLVRRSQSNSAPLISQAMELKLLLETWDPPDFIEPPEDPTCSVQHSVQTAEAYRWATLLYLHEAVPEIPSFSSAEMSKKVLVYLATVPLASRFVIVHIYPLLAAGCGAASSEERQWVQDRWTAMSRRMKIGPIDKSVEVTKEVWRRRDEYENTPAARRALVCTSNLHHRDTRIGFKRGHSFMTFNAMDGEPDFAPTERRRRATLGGSAERGRGHSRAANMGELDPEYTVRGRLHWLGVMKDWAWEVLLG